MGLFKLEFELVHFIIKLIFSIISSFLAYYYFFFSSITNCLVHNSENTNTHSLIKCNIYTQFTLLVVSAAWIEWRKRNIIKKQNLRLHKTTQHKKERKKSLFLLLNFISYYIIFFIFVFIIICYFFGGYFFLSSLLNTIIISHSHHLLSHKAQRVQQTHWAQRHTKISDKFLNVEELKNYKWNFFVYFFFSKVITILICKTTKRKK